MNMLANNTVFYFLVMTIFGVFIIWAIMAVVHFVLWCFGKEFYILKAILYPMLYVLAFCMILFMWFFITSLHFC